MYLFFLLFFFVQPFSLQHQNWDQNEKKSIAVSDVRWNYCDLKCLYLERYHPNLDFVVLIFQPIKNAEESIGACYVKQDTGIFSLWNTVIYNSFYNDICGKDNIDYNAEKDKYKLIQAVGEGKGI